MQDYHSHSKNTFLEEKSKIDKETEGNTKGKVRKIAASLEKVFSTITVYASPERDGTRSQEEFKRSLLANYNRLKCPMHGNLL